MKQRLISACMFLSFCKAAERILILSFEKKKVEKFFKKSWKREARKKNPIFSWQVPVSLLSRSTSQSCYHLLLLLQDSEAFLLSFYSSITVQINEKITTTI